METVSELVSAGAARRPGATAVIAADGRLTYAELDTNANRLAHHLRALHVGPDVRVGVCIERSVDLAVTLLAVLKAGGACLPLDPSYPNERLRSMVNDASAACVITREAFVDRFSPTGAPVLRVDADAADWADRPATSPPHTHGADDLAYVIYTSGSTGLAKGVMLTHRGLVNHHRAVIDLYGLGPDDRVLQFCSIGFDASIEELFPSWVAGATVVFRPEDSPLLGRDWHAWLRRHRITVMNLPTAYWHAWVQDLDALGAPVPEEIRLVVVGGGKASGPAYRRWRRAGGSRSRWINVYGPTETTCMSTFYEACRDSVPSREDWDPPIGKPLPNTVIRIVDDRLATVPDGSPGELLIGGAGLARGYLNQPGPTAERFVEHPDGGRLYRTGDLVRRLPTGDLEYLGRIDDQVKIQGFRVECGEVEAALARHPALAQAAVVAHDDPPGEKSLVAYIVGARAAPPAPTELRGFLAARLPAFMVPSAFIPMEALPLTPNGKVDRAGLRGRDAPATATPAAPPDGPLSASERRLARIWARVLGIDVERIGAGDDFFDLGGHSLLATQVVAQVREEFGTSTPLRALFERPTVAGLAAYLDADATPPRRTPPLAPRPRGAGARLPLSLAQEQMWALETLASPPGLFNVTALHTPDEPVDVNALRGALTLLIERHEILRTGYGAGARGLYQWVAPTAPVELGVTDLTGREHELRDRIAHVDARPFDASRPPLFRAHLFRLDGERTCVAITFDHLVSDGNGVAPFIRELDLALAGGELPPRRLHFADFAVWQRASITDDVLQRQLDWWAKALDGMPLGPAVPFDRRPSSPTRHIACEVLTVPSPTRKLLEELAGTHQTSVFVVAGAATATVLGQVGAATDVVLSTTLSGRNHPELDDMIGTFSGIGRLRCELSADPPFADLVRRSREHVLGMFENQDVPFMRVRRALLPDFPSAGIELVAALPIEFQYFRVAPDEPELFFRGQLHPLSITFLDDGSELNLELRYKTDFYDAGTIQRIARGLGDVLEAVAANPARRVSELLVSS